MCSSGRDPLQRRRVEAQRGGDATHLIAARCDSKRAVATLCIRSELRAGSNLNGRELRDRITALWNKDICEFASIGASIQKDVRPASSGFLQMHSRLISKAKRENCALPIKLSEVPSCQAMLGAAQGPTS